MKRHFLTGLKAFAVGALAFAAVSCYDDQPIWNEIEGLKDRVAALENLNADIANLNALHGKVTDLESSLKKLITDGDAAVKAALEQALADAIDALQADLEQAIADGDSALQSALEAEKAKIETALKNLQDGLDAVEGDVATLMTDVDALQTAIVTLEETLGVKYEELLGKIDAADGVLDGQITSLTAALDAVKKAYADADTKLKETISEEMTLAIAEALLDVTVQKVEEVDGVIVLTLADGTTVKLSKPLENVDNEGLVTVVEVDGAKYWAVVKDGEPESLGVLVGAPVELVFQVAEDGELQYSVNDSEWVSTGAYVADSTSNLFNGFYQGETDEEEWSDELWEYVPVLEDFYTLEFGGQKYYLPIYKADNSVVTIKAGKTYFTYGESKTIDVVIADVTSIYVMTKPDGWRANLDGNKLTVTAPAEANVTSGVAEADGEVLLHCTTVEGTCKVARLGVATTEGFSLTVDEKGNITIINPEVVTIYNWMTGMESMDFNNAYAGLAPVAAFEADPLAYVANCPDNYDDIIFTLESYKNNTMDWETGEYTVGGMYDPETYQVDILETSVADIYKFMMYSEVPHGSRFVVWACPVDENGLPRVADVVFGYYSAPISAVIEEVESTTNDIEVAVSVLGADSYYVGLVTEEMLYDWPIDDYMQNQEGPFGYFQMAVQSGMPEYAFAPMGILFGGEDGEQMPETIKASEIMGGALMPETKIYMWVFPVVDGLNLADYTYEKNLKPYIYEFTSTELTSGGTATVTFEEVGKEFNNVTVDITPTEGSTMVYYLFYDQDSYNELDDVETDLLENGNAVVDFPVSARATNDISKLTPGQKVVLAALAVDADGKYGKAVTDSFETKKLEFSTTFTASFGEETSSVFSTGFQYNFPITVTGGTAAKYYYVFSTEEYTAEELQNLPLTYNYNYSFRSTTSGVSEGMLKGQYATAESTYYLAVVVESTDGELAPVITKTVTVPAVPEEE